jgi:suppressor for copper-sensitivity B
MRSTFRSHAGLALALVLVAATTARGAAGPWAESAEARARLIAGAAGLGLEFELQPGWHVYWKNSGDAGYAPRLDFSATSAVRDARLLFPAPRRFELAAGLVSFGYERAVIYPIAATLDRSAAGPLPVRARLDYLVCREECIPHTAELTLELPAKAGADDVETARLARAIAALPLPLTAAPGAPRVTLAVTPAAGGALTLEVATAGGGWRAAAPDIFFETHPLFALGRAQLQATKSGLRYRIRLQPLDLTRPLPAMTEFAWTLTGFEHSVGGAPAPVALAGTTSVNLPR